MDKETQMESSKLYNRISVRSGEILAAVLLIQPLLDVLSYFMQDFGSTTVTTALRMLLLAAVSALGFGLSQRKKIYLVCYGVLAVYWAAHMLNCLRLGYADPVGDAAEYLKLVQFPLWTLTFITLLQNQEGLDLRTAGLLTANFAIVLGVIALSYAVGRPEYTYAGIRIGVLGWFAVPTAQSAIVCILSIGLLLWAYRTQHVWVFSVAAVFSFGLLYLTATRLTYYAAILIAAGFLVLVLIAGGRQRLCAISLGLALLLLILAINNSPMAQRRSIASKSYDIYQSQTDAIMGEDKDFVYTGGDLDPELNAKIHRVYEEVYTKQDAAGMPLLGDLLDRYGTDRIMEAYNYTTQAKTLYHTRTKKRMVLRLAWEDQDALSHLLGLEYNVSHINGNTYDVENDFPALLCYYGWLGTGLYCGFAAAVLLMVLAGLIKNLRRLPQFITPELGAYAMIFILSFGAAQYSGNVLRRPSVTVYLSLAAAQLYYALHGSTASLFAHYERRANLTIKN